MAIRTQEHIHCDNPGCGVERVRDQIKPTEPFYHIQITVMAVDREGTKPLYKAEGDICHYDGFTYLNHAWEALKADRDARVEASKQPQQEVMPDLVL